MLNFLTTTTVCGFSLYHVLAFFLIYSCTGSKNGQAAVLQER